MKKLTVILLILLSSSVLSQQSLEHLLNSSRIIPDVMGYVNAYDNINKSNPYITFNIDSFPLFPGFPKQLTGNTAEGFIYCNMDADADLEIVFNTGFNVNAINMDGSFVTGWPKTVTSYSTTEAPAFGDIDGDGQGEVVVTNHGLTSGGFIFAFKKDGTPVPGFPINHGYSTRTPVLANVDTDAALEIIVNKRIYPTGEVYVYKGNGTIMTGWPKPISHVPASSAAVGDVDGDNAPEIIMEAYDKLFVWKSNGDLLTGFPFTYPNSDVASYSAPVLADLSGDGKRDIIFGTHVLGGGGFLYVLKYDATTFGSWPQTTGAWIYAPPSVGDANGDGQLEVFVGDQILSGTPMDYLYGWNKNGVALTGFPIGPVNAINAQAIMGDIDNDNQIELIFDDNSTLGGLGKYLAYNHTGTPVTGWPINVTGTTFFHTPALLDVNNNGILDIFGGGYTSTGTIMNVYLWNTGMNWNPAKIILPMWQYNARHNGVYGDLDIIVGAANNQNEIPKEFILEQNYPNPFNPGTVINFQLSIYNNVQIKVFDINGKEIEILIDKYMSPGKHEVKFDGTNYPSGVYFYTLTAGDFIDTKKMILIK